MLFYLLLAIASSAEPSVAQAERLTCFKTSVTKRGRFISNAVAVSSGKQSVDSEALRFMRNVDLSYASPKAITPQSGYIVVKTAEGGVFVEFTGQLLDTCPAAANGT